MNEMQKDIRRILHSKSAGLLLFALLLTGIFAVFFLRGRNGGEQEPLLTLGVVDQEQDAYTELLLRYFKDNDSFSGYIRLVEGTKAETEQKFQNGELDGWVLIPEGFVEGMIRIEHTPLVVTLSDRDATKTILLRNLFQAYGQYVEAVETGCMALYRQMEADGFPEEEILAANWKISLELLSTALERDGLFAMEEWDGAEQKSLGFYYGCSFAALLPFLFAMAGGSSMIGERESGVLDRIRITNGGNRSWFISKLLLYGGSSAAVVLGLWLAAAFCTGEQPEKLSWVVTGRLLVVVLIVFGIVLAMLASALLFQGKREYLLAAGMTVMLLAVLGGSILPLRFLPDALAEAAEFLPNRILASALLSL